MIIGFRLQIELNFKRMIFIKNSSLDIFVVSYEFMIIRQI